MIGLPIDVVRYVDVLIDTGKCGKHDIGLEIYTEKLSEELNLEAALELGVRRLFECLGAKGKLGEDYLKAAALHFLLDCVDRRMKSLGTLVFEGKAREALEDCIEWIDAKLRTQSYRYFLGEGLGEIEELVVSMRHLLDEHGAVLERCVDYIAEENRSKETPEIGSGTIARLLSEVCRRRGIKCLFYVNGKLLPPASAAKKALSLLMKGEKVELVSIEGKIRITANNSEEFFTKIMEILGQ
ncbi:hypothetical protein TCARB_0943 [Thermofilum adornatum 1505]|uniref:Uncharacterized protein n=1 Tax=Thermofilum adornatum 1505 TaxID=697581 RepID=A0A3G1A709_9CREN|nr:hypothetical protein [Thermofilum adornatum]AJB41993.1 hypothetical protein TCARB_0943 [Thermofilum adornatum 1505]